MGTNAVQHNELPKVAYISDKIYPHHNTDTQQVIKNASALQGAGLSVNLLIPVQMKSLTQPGYDVAEEIYHYYNVENKLNIEELPGFPAGGFLLERFFHPFIACLHACFTRRYDVIYTRDKFPALLAFFLGKKVVFETYRRLGDESPRVMGWLAKKARKSNFIGMVLHSRVAATSMLKAGFPREKLLVLHNGYDNSDMRPVLTKAEARAKLGLSQLEQYVVYTGNMQKNKCIESLIDIAALVPGARFLLVGGTAADVDRLRAYARVKNAGNVILLGHQPIAIVSQFLYAADVLIIPPVTAPLEKYGRTVLPFKAFPYLAAGRPIVAPDAVDIRELLVHDQNAILVQADNAAQNAEAIAELLADRELQNRLAFQATALSKSLTWEIRAQKLLSWLGSKWQAATQASLPPEEELPARPKSSKKYQNSAI